MERITWLERTEREAGLTPEGYELWARDLTFLGRLDDARSRARQARLAAAVNGSVAALHEFGGGEYTQAIELLELGERACHRHVELACREFDVLGAVLASAAGEIGALRTSCQRVQTSVESNEQASQACRVLEVIANGEAFDAGVGGRATLELGHEPGRWLSAGTIGTIPVSVAVGPGALSSTGNASLARQLGIEGKAGFAVAQVPELILGDLVLRNLSVVFDLDEGEGEDTGARLDLGVRELSSFARLDYDFVEGVFIASHEPLSSAELPMSWLPIDMHVAPFVQLELEGGPVWCSVYSNREIALTVDQLDSDSIALGSPIEIAGEAVEVEGVNGLEHPQVSFVYPRAALGHSFHARARWSMDPRAGRASLQLVD